MTGLALLPESIFPDPAFHSPHLTLSCTVTESNGTQTETLREQLLPAIPGPPKVTAWPQTMEFIFLEALRTGVVGNCPFIAQMCTEPSCVLVSSIDRQGLGLKSAHSPGDRTAGTPALVI